MEPTYNNNIHISEGKKKVQEQKPLTLEEKRKRDKKKRKELKSGVKKAGLYLDSRREGDGESEGSMD